MQPVKAGVISVPSNIAEGSVRKIVYIAKGSLAEIQMQVMLAQRPGFIEPQPELLKNLSIALTNLVGSLAKS